MIRVASAIALALALAAGCSGNPPGLYLELTSTVKFEHVDLFFGGHFPSLLCDGSLESDPVAPPTSTAHWTNTDASGADHVFRRQTASTTATDDSIDSFEVSPSGPPYTTTIRIPSGVDPSLSLDALGLAVIAVASTGGSAAGSGSPVAVGELDNFEVPDDRAVIAPIELLTVAADQLEVWGPVGAAKECVRYSHDGVSAFVVTKWDHDCDGVLEQNCAEDTMPVTIADCDPLAYCGVDANNQPTAGCTSGTFGACLTPDLGVNGCALGECSNTPGSQTMMCGPPVAGNNRDVCLQTDECGCSDQLSCEAMNCDRPALECGMTRGAANVECNVPVDMAHGTLCQPATLLVPTTFGACTVFATTPLTAGAQVGVTVTAGSGGGCELDLAATMRGSGQGVLPDLRVLIAPPEPGLASNLVDIAPVKMDCSGASQVVCQAGTGTAPPAGMCVLGSF